MFVIVAGLAVLVAVVAVATYQRSADWPSTVVYKAEVYTETSSGFRYRLLDTDVSDGYDAVIAKLLPGEQLYRMMEDAYRFSDELYPVLINDRIKFDQSVNAKSTRGWKFQLAAGIPRDLDQEAEQLLKSYADEG